MRAMRTKTLILFTLAAIAFPSATTLSVSAASTRPLPNVATPQPQTGANCNLIHEYRVCINIIGTGLHVDSVTPYEHESLGNGTICAIPSIIINGRTDKTGPRQCAATPTWTYRYNANSADGTVICAHWSNEGADACLTIHR